MKQDRRNKIVAAPIVSGVVGVFTFFMLYGMAGLSEMKSTIAGLPFGLFVSAIFAVIVASALFGELLARAIEGK